MTDLTRRIALKLFAAGTATSLGTASTSDAQDGTANASDGQMESLDPWSNNYDRIWLGGRFWANPMEDWHIRGGAAECRSAKGDRNVHLVTHQLVDGSGSFKMSIAIHRVAQGARDGGTGFRLGIRSDLNESRSNCFAKGGIAAGVIDGKLILDGATTEAAEAGSRLDTNEGLTLVLEGRPGRQQTELRLTAESREGETLAELVQSVAPRRLLGNVSIVSNFEANNGGQGARYRFHDWKLGGPAFRVQEEDQFGPLLWSMYSLSDSRTDEGFVLKLSALTGPLGAEDNRTVQLLIQAADGSWQHKAEAELDTDAWVASFRLPNWDETRATSYRLVYREHFRDGSEVATEWSGTIKPNPEGRPVRLGALTCQKDYGFPYEPVANNLVKLDPDLLFFAGDQLYEDHGGYGLIRDPAEPAILNYLRKFYMFGWAFRHAMKDRPTLCIPDDHDVFQGNIWGEGGAKMKDLAAGTSSKGGYREPARMVNVVHRTCAAHHPDPFDATPVEQGISVYYGDLVYGRVSFAILADRQFKSGPEHVETGSGRADHVRDPEFDTRQLDQPNLVLLGERQEQFLQAWGRDWRNHDLKVLLSQTVFAGVATHHGGFNGYLKADLDSGGWPQSARDRTVEILRAAAPLHVNGDQHLTTLAQYGVEAQRDSCWSFCVPAIAAGYPRWWRPDDMGVPHSHRPKHGLANTGEYLDGFGNKVYVYAVGNPEARPQTKSRYEMAHRKGSGFGLVTIDPKAKTYRIEAFRFLVDATDDTAENQFPGWPVVIHQEENRGVNRIT